MKKQQLSIIQLFDLNHTIADELLRSRVFPWEVLPEIHDFIRYLGSQLPEDEYQKLGSSIWIGKGADIAQTVAMKGPAIIGKNAQIRHSAFIRGSVIIGNGAVVGNSTELKNAILFDGVQVPHYNYVGDSILGYKAHMGAGAITSNVKSDKSMIVIPADDEKVETGLKKMGAMLGDYVEVGCNSVLNPGTIIGKKSNIYPLSNVRGCIAPNSIYKNQGEIVEKYEVR